MNMYVRPEATVECIQASLINSYPQRLGVAWLRANQIRYGVPFISTSHTMAAIQRLNNMQRHDSLENCSADDTSCFQEDES